MNFSLKKISLITFLALIAAVAAVVFINRQYSIATPDFPDYSHAPVSDTNTPPATSTTTTYNLPPTLLLKVPFTTQAPFSNWDKIHNEDCEEASAVMANAYFNGSYVAKLDPNYVDGQLTNLTNWEMQNFGYNLDINSQETVKMIEANYNLHARVVNNLSQDDIKNELRQNHLVLIPVNGQMIGNPNYKRPGPIYHMLVVRGYTPSSIITNDPGTRNGLNYPYSFSTLYNANGNYDHSTNKVNLNDKNMIVVWK